MAIGSELEEILLRWEEHRDRGQPITIEELCDDHPELLAEARRLVRTLADVDALISEGGGESDEQTRVGRGSGPVPADISTGSHYSSVQLHAHGGLGDVFLAFDEELGREVALKLIQRPYDRDPGRRERFLREAEITARLGHPGIVPIFGLGRTGDGRPCYSMKFIEGETLQAAIARFHAADSQGQSSREHVLIFRGLLARLVTVCQAVAFAHSRGVIHRDLKPDNIMLGPYQETLVVDWGLAKRWGEDGHDAVDKPDAVTSGLPEGPIGDSIPEDSLTRIGSTLGTPAYMSPEQAAGRLDEVGPASDVYSLGATLYMLLTGRPAFRNRSRSGILGQVQRGEFPPPCQVNGTIRPALGAICMKAMALRPSDRYASVVDMAADLERWLADEPVSAWREPATVRLGRWVRRHRPLVTGLAALAATALIALAVSTLLLGKEQAKTKNALDDARSNYRLARTTLADVQTSFGLAATDRMAPLEGMLWFAEASETSDVDPERALASRLRARGWARHGPTPIAVLAFPENPARENGLANGISQLAFDGRGRHLLAISNSGVCVVHDVLEDRPVLLPGGSRTVSAAAWGGKARDLLALGNRDGVIEMIRIPAGNVVERLDLKRPVDSLEFSADGNLLAIGSERTRVWNLAKKDYVTPELIHPGRVVHVVFNPRADRLATAAGDGRVRVYDLSSPTAAPLFETATSLSPGVRFSPQSPFRPVFVDQGRGVLTLPGDRELAWFDATTGREVRRLPVDLDAVHDAFASPNDRAIAILGFRGALFLDSRTGEHLGRIGGGSAEAAAFSPDGKWLLVANGNHVIVPFQFPGGARTNWGLPLQDTPNKLTIAGHGSYFAFSQNDGLVRVYVFLEVPPGDRLSKTASASSHLAMSADGRLVMPLGKDLTVGPSFTQVHDLATGKVGPDLHVNGILHGGAISSDGRNVVTLSSPAGVLAPEESELKYPVGSAKGWAQLWGWQHGQARTKPIPTPSEPVGAAFSPDGRRLVVACALGECLWIDPTDGRIIHVNRSRGFRYQPGWPASELLRFSPDGKLLALWGIGPPILLDAPTGAEHSPALSSQLVGAFDARFTPDGRYMATLDQDKNARVWDLATGQLAAPALAHPDWVFQAKFSADGSMLLTACRDGNARVWDWRAGKLLGPPLTHRGEVQDVGFLNEDRWALTKSSENLMQIWDWRAGKPLIPARVVASASGSQLCLSADGQRGAIGSTSEQAIHVFDLPRWIDTEDPRFSIERIRATSELLSGQRIEGGSSVVGLTTDEWMERWRAYRRQTPKR